MPMYGKKAKTGSLVSRDQVYGAGDNYRNPNAYADLNDAPVGPFAHELGYSDDGGVHGQANVSHRGTSYHFK